MGTLTAKLTLNSSNLTTDSINIAFTDILNITKDVRIFKKVIAASETELVEDQTILSAASYTKSYVFFYNTSSTTAEVITLGTASNDGSGDNALDTVNISLGAGEFAFYPWNSTVDIVADAASGSPVLEIGIFEA